MVAEQYERVIKLAQRAMELERELEQVRRELASNGAGGGGGAVAKTPASRAIDFEDDELPESEDPRIGSDDDLAASLAKQMLAVYKTHSSRSLTSEQVAKALGISDPTRVNMLRSYAVRFSKTKNPRLKKTKRGHYQFVR